MNVLAADYQELGHLVRRANAGDSDAFTAIYEQTYQNTYFLAYSLLHNEQDAQDALQETYLQVFRNLSNLRDESLFIAWANRIAYHACMRIIAHRQPTVEDETLQSLTGEGAEENNPLQDILAEERNEALTHLMDFLPDVLKSTLILRFYNDLKIHEIASIMGCPAGTVKSRLNTAKRLLKNTVATHRYEEALLGSFTVAMIRPALIGASERTALAPEPALAILRSALAESQLGDPAGFVPRPPSPPPLHAHLSSTAMGGLALAVTALGTVLAVQAAIAGNAVPVFGAVQFSDQWTNRPVAVSAQISAPRSPIRQFYASAEDGSNYTGSTSPSGDSEIALPRNGTYTLYAVGENEKSTAYTVCIDSIDQSLPTLLSAEEREGLLYLSLSDEGAGIDVKSISLQPEDGPPLPPASVDGETGEATFPLLTGRFTLRFADLAGNSVWYWVSVSPKGAVGVSPPA